MPAEQAARAGLTSRAVPDSQTDRNGQEEKFRLYQETSDTGLRNELLMDYIYLVRRAAVQLRGVLTSSVQEEDLVNQGAIALMECIDRYDCTRGAKFETYAYMRVRGALIDYIRRQDWVPHRTRRLGRQIDEAYMILANEKMREPSVEEIAEYLNLPKGKLDQNIKAMDHSIILSFENVLQELAEYAAKAEPVGQNIKAGPEESFFMKETKRVLTEAIGELSDKERLVVTLYYYEELKYAQIADIMDISESRVCQIHTKAILKLKIQLEKIMKG